MKKTIILPLLAAAFALTGCVDHSIRVDCHVQMTPGEPQDLEEANTILNQYTEALGCPTDDNIITIAGTDSANCLSIMHERIDTLEVKLDQTEHKGTCTIAIHGDNGKQFYSHTFNASESAD